MKETSGTARMLPPGWRVVDNSAFVSPLQSKASAFADSILVEYDKLFGLYTKSESQVLIMEDVPDDDTLTRARSILHDRGYRCLVDWVQVIQGKRTARLDVFKYESDDSRSTATGSERKAKPILRGFIRLD